jgi:rRNA maturation endonuclease Nob1
MKPIKSPAIVEAAAYTGFASNIFRALFKWSITCGSCGISFSARVPTLPYPVVRCPYCGVGNRLDVEPAH